MIREFVVDALSFMFVEGVFKQLLKSAENENSTFKKDLWLKEFYVLSIITFLYLCFDHTPYFLFLMTAATYLFTQYSRSLDEISCDNCLAYANECSCKIPGNISFRSPLATIPPNNRGRLSSIPNRMRFEAGNVATPPRSLNADNLVGKMTPFDAFKGNLRANGMATSTPRPRSSPNLMNSPTKNQIAWQTKIVRLVTVIHYFVEKLLKLISRNCLRLREFIEKQWKPPIVEAHVSMKTQTSISAIKSALLLTISAIKGSEYLEKPLDNNNVDFSSEKNSKMRIILKFVFAKVCYVFKISDNDGVSNMREVMKTVFSSSNFSKESNLSYLVDNFGDSFDVNDEIVDIKLKVSFESLLKQFLGKVDESTRKRSANEETKSLELRLQMKSVAKQCQEDLENCDGIFGGNYYFLLGKLSMAHWILQQAKQGASSLVSTSFEGQLAETMFCSSCDSFAYNFKKFSILDLDILVAPSNQARKITTIEDCLQFLVSKKRVKKSRSFQCVCYDEFIQQHCPVSSGAQHQAASDQYFSLAPRQVSFADENEVYSGSGDALTANKAKEPSPKILSSFTHYSRMHFAQLPQYLILNLNRFAPDEKTGKIVKTINQLMVNKSGLDLYPMTTARQSKEEYPGIDVVPEEFKYSLSFIIAHSGYTFDDGEYISYMKVSNSMDTQSSREPLWLKITSTDVQKISIAAEVNSKFVRENAVVVVYEKLI